MTYFVYDFQSSWFFDAKFGSRSHAFRAIFYHIKQRVPR